MKVVFEVLRFIFELIYASYQYEIEKQKIEHYLEPPANDSEFIRELNE